MLTLVICCAASGCVSQPPGDIDRHHRFIVGELNRRSRQVRTISGSGRLILTRSKGPSVELRIALAARQPDRLRIRAWKWTQLAFDVTTTPQGIWVALGDEGEVDADATSLGELARNLGRALAMASGAIGTKGWERVQSSGEVVKLVRAGSDETARVTCEIDPIGPTIRSLKWQPPDGPSRRITWDRFTRLGPFLWPMRMVGDSQTGSFELLWVDVELNSDLPADVFVPPPAGEKLR